MLRIACLHTAESNIETFEAARRRLRLDDVVLRHRVRADLLALLAAAEKAGGSTETILQRSVAELATLARASDAVLLTCSTLGPAAAMANAASPVPILQVDEALAREAVKDGGIVIALCTSGTTIAPTRSLFERAALATGAEVEVRLVPGAWERFKAGEHQAYLAMIADAADAAAREGAAIVALAQASMTGAAARCREARPLTCPTVGLVAAIAAAETMAKATTTRS